MEVKRKKSTTITSAEVYPIYGGPLRPRGKTKPLRRSRPKTPLNNPVATPSVISYPYILRFCIPSVNISPRLDTIASYWSCDYGVETLLSAMPAMVDLDTTTTTTVDGLKETRR